MSEDKSTPRPWRYQERSDAYTHIIRAGDDQFVVQFSQDRTGRSEADARLIVAAVNACEDNRQGAEALAALVDAVGKMRVPQTLAEAALQVHVTLGPAYLRAREIVDRLEGQKP